MDHSDTSASTLGDEISRHGRSRATVLALILGIVLPLGALVLPWLLLDNPHFDPSAKPMLIKASVFLFALGVVMLLLWKFGPPRDVIVIHQQGIARHESSGNVTLLRFEDMADIYRFRTGGYSGGMINALAVRSDADQPWIAVMDNRRQAFILRNAILHFSLRARVPVALAALDEGHAVRFHLIDNNERLVKRFTGGVFKVKTRVLELRASGVDVDGRHIPIHMIHGLSGADGTGQIALLDAEGGTLYSVHYLSLFSADLFTTLLGELLQARRPAYEHLMAH